MEPDIAFAPYVPILEGFAKKHNLQVETYRQGAPQWSFYFAHPVDGYGRIDIQIYPSGDMYLLKWWTVIDFKKSRQSMKTSRPLPVKDVSRLESVMREGIQDILQWSLADLGDSKRALLGPEDKSKIAYPELKLV